VPSSSQSGFEPGVDAPTRRALLDLRKQVVELNGVVDGLTTALEKSPKGVVAWKRGALAGTPLSVTPITVYTLAAPLVAGRMYELKITSRAMSSAGNVRVQAVVSPAVTNFTVDAYVWTPGSYGSISWDALVVPTATQSHTFTVSASVSTGTGALWTELNSGIWVKDIGPAIGSS
jgi:hypothetical protein